MSKKGMKSYFRNTISFTLVFALVCVGIIGSVWSKGVYENRTIQNTDDPKTSESYINTLLLGVDKDGYRTDVIIFAQLNLVNNSLSMLQIPRDTYTSINKFDKKINSSFLTYKDGKLTTDIKSVYEQVGYLTGMEVHNHLLVNTKGFRDIIDALGGLDFDVPQRMLYDDPEQGLFIDLYPGMQHLNGDKAEQLIRFRKNNDGTGYAMGDLERNKVQRNFIFAVIDKVFSLSGVTKIPELISIITSSLQTSFSSAQMLQYAPFIMSLDKENISIVGLEGVAEYRNGASYFIPNDNLNNEIFSTYFVDESTVNNSANAEVARRDKLMSDEDNTIIETDFSKEIPSLLEKLFVKIQIVDGSEGTADIEDIKLQLTNVGYNVTDVVNTGITYQKSRIISDTKNDNANAIASSLSFSDYIVSQNKTSNHELIIVVGKNWND